MGMWTDAVENKALIIHGQMLAAHQIAQAHQTNIGEVVAPYLRLLNSLYDDEYVLARMADSSDLITRFAGRAVEGREPPISIVISVFRTIRDEVRGIAKAIAGLSTDQSVQWPAHLDPHLSGLARGSIVVGITVPSPTADAESGQLVISEASEEIFRTVKAAVRSLPVVARHVHEDSVDDAGIRERFPDPAIRDTVMVAARRLAPSGRKGIDTVSFLGQGEDPTRIATLTPRGKTALGQALQRPVRSKRRGTFEGVIREMDLDARRFEIRNVLSVGAIRCIYSSAHDERVRTLLDARVVVSGEYEVFGSDDTPRLLAVDTVQMRAPPPAQRDMFPPA